jgi:hypothetical protein
LRHEQEGTTVADNVFVNESFFIMKEIEQVAPGMEQQKAANRRD